MDNLLLKLALSTRKTVKSTLAFCKDRAICQRNKRTFVSKLLKLSGYNIPKDSDPIPIYTELAELSSRKSSYDVENRIRMTPEFNEIISKYGSENLKSFLLFNGIFILVKENKFEELKGKGMVIKQKLEELYSNPVFAAKLNSLYPGIAKYAKKTFKL
jgi:hypothetical protein